MATTKRNLTHAELSAPFVDELGARYGPVISPSQLAELLNLSTKTVYEWVAKGRLRGATRRRGKHVLIWRDKALDQIFNGADW